MGWDSVKTWEKAEWDYDGADLPEFAEFVTHIREHPEWQEQRLCDLIEALNPEENARPYYGRIDDMTSKYVEAVLTMAYRHCQWLLEDEAESSPEELAEANRLLADLNAISQRDFDADTFACIVA